MKTRSRYIQAVLKDPALEFLVPSSEHGQSEGPRVPPHSGTALRDARSCHPVLCLRIDRIHPHNIYCAPPTFMPLLYHSFRQPDQYRVQTRHQLTTGACTINRPCAQQYVGKSQSCMVISGRLIVHAPVALRRA